MVADLVNLDNDACDHERCASKFEEVVSSAGLVHRENGCEDVTQLLLEIVGGCHIFAFVGSYLRCRQCTPVDLLILIERNSVDLHGSRRHHVRRFAVTDERIEYGRVNLDITDHVCRNELAAVRVIEGLHGSVLDTRELANDRFNLLEFDTETANLDLSVTSADELNISVRQITNYISGSIPSGCWLLAISRWPFYVDLCGPFGLVEVSAANLRSADPQFAYSTKRQALAVAVHDDEAEVIQGLADRYVLLVSVEAVGGGEDCTLGRSIAVVHGIAGRRRESGKRLTAHGQMTQAAVVNVRCKLEADLRGHERVGYALLIEIYIQIGQAQSDIIADDIHRSAHGERRIHIHHISIEPE